jgi:hypothetical protein
MFRDDQEQDIKELGNVKSKSRRVSTAHTIIVIFYMTLCQFDRSYMEFTTDINLGTLQVSEVSARLSVSFIFCSKSYLGCRCTSQLSTNITCPFQNIWCRLPTDKFARLNNNVLELRGQVRERVWYLQIGKVYKGIITCICRVQDSNPNIMISLEKVQLRSTRSIKGPSIWMMSLQLVGSRYETNEWQMHINTWSIQVEQSLT